jgi:hypothetical protein
MTSANKANEAKKDSCLDQVPSHTSLSSQTTLIFDDVLELPLSAAKPN